MNYSDFQYGYQPKAPFYQVITATERHISAAAEIVPAQAISDAAPPAPAGTVAKLLKS